MNIDMQEDEDILTVEVSFPADSESGRKVNTDIVRRKVEEAGYDFLTYKSTDAVVDEAGEEVTGTWQFKIPSKDDEEDKSEFTKKMLMDVKGIGSKKAQRVVDKYDGNKEKFLSDLKKRNLRIKGITSSAVERLREKYL